MTVCIYRYIYTTTLYYSFQNFLRVGFMIRLKRYIQSISVGANSLFKTLKPVDYLCMKICSFFPWTCCRYP